MSWKWDQSAGVLSRGDTVVSRGYSGFARGKNNPIMQAAVGVGPIPAGRWRITERYDSANVGPYALKLEPVGHNALGRSAFRIHGDSVASPGTASHGCIILPRTVRVLIWESGDRDLEVVP
jgi:hypothetical protein